MMKQLYSRMTRLKKDQKYGRLALEISLILIIKIMLLWLLWALCFSNPIPKDDRESAVTRMILNHSN